MTRSVFDASAVLAFLLNEPGAGFVEEALTTGGFMATMNLAEVVQKLSRQHVAKTRVRAIVDKLALGYVAVDLELAMAAGWLVVETASRGLSLADRCCLGLARRLDLPVLTADRKWVDVAEAIGVRLVLIR